VETEFIIFAALLKVITSKAITNNLGTKFNFRNYYFFTLAIKLNIKIKAIIVYLNTRYFIIFINKVFLKELAPLIKIYFITTIIIIRGINSNRYFINKYILLFIFISKKRNNKDIVVKFIREVYLINNLKVKILISTDIISFKNIDIIIFKDEVYINLYNIIININLKPRSRGVI
jgi:hypothetical protein